ncbi:hypothetical protein [Desulforhopalus sp. 52FAK]
MEIDVFQRQVEQLKQKVSAMVDDTSDDYAEEVALRLTGLNFTPPVITPIKEFIRMRNDDLILEIDRIVAMPDAEACALAPGDSRKCADLRLQYITVLLYYYTKLVALRAGDAEEWDEVDELYVHD